MYALSLIAIGECFILQGEGKPSALRSILRHPPSATADAAGTAALPDSPGVNLEGASAHSWCTSAQSTGTCVETIDLFFDAEPLEVRAVVERLQWLLFAGMQGELGQPEGAVNALRLRLQPYRQVESYESCLIRASLVPLDGSYIERRSAAYRLQLLRYAWWEGLERPVPLTNPNGGLCTDGLLIWNHCDQDPGHVNWADIAGEAISGDMPGDVRVLLSPAPEDAVDGDTFPQRLFFYLTCPAYGLQRAPDNFSVLEGETWEGGVASGSAASCSGSASRVRSVTAAEISGSAQTPLPLFQVSLSGSWLGYFPSAHGQVLLRPSARFAETPQVEDLWIGWNAVSGSGIGQRLIAESAFAALESCPLQELPLLRLPFSGGGSVPDSSLRLTLLGLRASGSYCLNLDYVHFASLGGFNQWRRVNLFGDFGPSDYVVDAPPGWGDGEAPVSTVPFSAEGDRLSLIPGIPQRLSLLCRSAADCWIAQRFYLRLFYKPRWRNL